MNYHARMLIAYRIYIAFSHFKMPNTPIEVAICDLKHAVSDSASSQPTLRCPACEQYHEVMTLKESKPYKADYGKQLPLFWQDAYDEMIRAAI